MDSPSLREQALAAYVLGPDAVVALVEGLVAGFGEQIERVTARVTAVEAENAALRQEVRELRGRLVKDSRNSSKPPSSDGPSWPDGGGCGRDVATAVSRRRRMGRVVYQGRSGCRRACGR